ncbi:MAG: hypothetical protein AAF702_42215, partial [Chloroflexota bacterium]
MTIRLKLTLLYSLILTLVVVLFSIVLYTLQNRAAFEIVERSLAGIHRRTVNPGPGRPPQDADQRSEPFVPRDNFNQPLVQLRDLENSILQKSDSIGDASLPLSDSGFSSVLQGETWLERAFVEEEWFLIRSELDTTGGAATVESAPMIVQVALPI